MRRSSPQLGVRRLEDVIGRTDLLHQVSRGSEMLDDLDLNPLLAQADPGGHARYCTLEGRNEVPETLDAQMIDDAHALFERGEKMQLQYTIRNTHRAIGTKISSKIARRFGMTGLQPGHLTVRLRGSAGQSLGAFAVQGLKLEVFGDANDYVGKGLSGATHRGAARAVLDAAQPARTPSSATPCCTARPPGELFAAGQAGERFAVRNSGATAVVEGCGSNGCEYMTGGTVVILGAVGDNFGAGFTGGMAFVYDPDGCSTCGSTPTRCPGSASRIRIGRRCCAPGRAATSPRPPAATPRGCCTTGTARCRDFWQVVPKEYVKYLPVPLSADAAEPKRA